MTGFHRVSLLASLGLLACGGTQDPVQPGPSSGGNSQMMPSAGTTSNPTAGAAGSNATTGGVGVGGSGTTAGTTSTGGTAGAPSGGTTTGGTSTGGAGGGSAGAGDPLDTLPTHTLNVTASAVEHMHTVAGMPALLDARLPKMVGKLIIDVEVDSGGSYAYGVKHGFHVLGPGMFHCDIAQSQDAYTADGKSFNGDCRLETFDGVDHDKSTATGHAQVTPANSISGRVQAALTQLQGMYPEEDWGYYLAADGSVRWSDVGFTGYSHGASSSARWGKAVRLWRVVARSGPRDNICGVLYSGKTCKEDVISAWLDDEDKTPLDRIYGLAGTTDSEYGDIIFAMERMKYLGAPVDIKSMQPPYAGSHRLIANGVGHDDFNEKNGDRAYWPTMDYVWATPAENIAYANAHPG